MQRCFTSRTSSGGRYTLNCAFSVMDSMLASSLSSIKRADQGCSGVEVGNQASRCGESVGVLEQFSDFSEVHAVLQIQPEPTRPSQVDRHPEAFVAFQ